MPPVAARPNLSLFEFTALMAMMSACVAFSIDAMLPGLQAIGAELAPNDPSKPHYVVLGFFLGLAIGTLFAGPISDALGRRGTIVGGVAIYCLGALWAWASGSFEALVLARVVQGIGLGGPRVASMAMIRDLYKGQDMARVVSLMMIVFVLVPALAPMIGAIIIDLAGWRSVFLTFILFAGGVAIWLMRRQHETLLLSARRPLKLRALWYGLIEILRLPRVILIILVQSTGFAMLFVVLSSSHQVFDIHFHRTKAFPFWFGLLSIGSALGGYFNACLVKRTGLERIVAYALQGQLVITLFVLALAKMGALPFTIYLFWLCTVFLTLSFTIGNLSALGLEPLGHLAGLGASILSALSTSGAVGLSMLVDGLLDGQVLKQIAAIGIICSIGVILMLVLAAKQNQPVSKHILAAT